MANQCCRHVVCCGSSEGGLDKYLFSVYPHCCCWCLLLLVPAAVLPQDPELFELIATASLGSLYDLSPHSLSDIITAFARARDPQAEKVRHAGSVGAQACSSGSVKVCSWAGATVCSQRYRTPTRAVTHMGRTGLSSQQSAQGLFVAARLTPGA